MRHTDRLAKGENPEAVAKEAIRVLEKALKEEFGVDLHIGAELEFEVQIPPHLHPPKPGGTFNPLQGEGRSFKRQYRKSGQPLPSDTSYTPAGKKESVFYTIDLPDRVSPGTLKAHDVSDAVFPRSPIVAYTYHEEELPHEGWHNYEAVISHEAMDEIPFGEDRGLYLARCIEATRKTIAHTPPERRAFAIDPLGKKKESDDPEHNAWLARMAHGIQERNTSGFGPFCTHGMHLNVTLDIDGVPYFGKQAYGQPRQERQNALIRGMSEIFNENAYLLHASAPSLVRAMQRREQTGNTGIQMKKKERLEITRAPTDANPYYATMLALAGVYYTLHDYRFDQNTQVFHRQEKTLYVNSINEPNKLIYNHMLDYKHSINLETKMKEVFFDKHRLLEKTLNGLEPELGARFMDAIKRMPPGQEKTEQQAGICHGH